MLRGIACAGLTSLLLAGAAACEHAAREAALVGPASPVLRAGGPDPEFRLGPAERAKVLPYFDADALERLLSMLPARARERTLASFQATRPGEPHGHLVGLGHPALDAVLAEVWAPYWEGVPDEEMAQHPGRFPGRELAMERRAARRRAAAGQP